VAVAGQIAVAGTGWDVYQAIGPGCLRPGRRSALL